MKKFKNIVTVIALAIFMISVFNGYSQEQNFAPEDLGDYHNEILKQYNTINKIKKHKLDRSKLKEDLSKIASQIATKVDLPEDLEIALNKFYVRNSKKLDKDSPKIFIDYLIDNKAISSKLSTLFYSLHYSIINKDEKQINLFLYKIRNETLDEKDDKYRKAFISVFDASKKYWSVNKSRGWTAATFFADAIGGAAGLCVSGGNPFASLFCGAYASALFYDAQYWEAH